MKDEKKKGLAALIVSGMDKPETEEKEESDSGHGDLDLIARDVVNASRNNDPVAMSKALCAFIDVYQKDDGESDDEGISEVEGERA